VIDAGNSDRQVYLGSAVYLPQINDRVAITSTPHTRRLASESARPSLPASRSRLRLITRHARN